MPWISKKEWIKQELKLTQAELKIKEQEEYINNLKMAVQLASSETDAYRDFIKNTLRGYIHVDEELEPTFDFKPKMVRRITKTIIIPKFVISAKESDELRAIIDELTGR